MLKSVPSLTIDAFPSSIENNPSLTSPLIPLYKPLCSKNKTGFGSSIELINNPFASWGVEGYTTFNPGTWVNHDSLFCEWKGPAPIPPPHGILTVTLIDSPHL